MNKENRWFVKAMNLKRFILPFLLPFYCWKEWKACPNFWEFLGTFKMAEQAPCIQAPRIQNRGRFHCFNIVQPSQPLGKHFLALLKLPHVGCAQTFKVPTSFRGPAPSRS